MSLNYFAATWGLTNWSALTLSFSKDIKAMPGSDKDDPFLLVICEGNYFDVVQYLYTDHNGERMFTNGDCPGPESHIKAWAMLPDLSESRQ